MMNRIPVIQNDQRATQSFHVFFPDPGKPVVINNNRLNVVLFCEIHEAVGIRFLILKVFVPLIQACMLEGIQVVPEQGILLIDEKKAL